MAVSWAVAISPVGVLLLISLITFIDRRCFGGRLTKCACCNPEAQTIKRVMRKFPAVPPSQLAKHEGKVVKLVGRVAHNGRVLFAPFTNRQCVFYRACVESQSRAVATELNSCDFLITDAVEGSVSAAWVPGASPDKMLDTPFYLYAKTDMEIGLRRSVFSETLPHWKTFLQRHNYWQDPDKFDVTTRRLRLTYSEGVFEPGELVACIGVVHRVKFPNRTVWTLKPLRKSAMNTDDWAGQEVKALDGLDGQVVITDDPDAMGDVSMHAGTAPPASFNSPDFRTLSRQSTAFTDFGRPADPDPNHPYFEPKEAPPPPYHVYIPGRHKTPATVAAAAARGGVTLSVEARGKTTHTSVGLLDSKIGTEVGKMHTDGVKLQAPVHGNARAKVKAVEGWPDEEWPNDGAVFADAVI